MYEVFKKGYVVANSPKGSSYHDMIYQSENAKKGSGQNTVPIPNKKLLSE